MKSIIQDEKECYICGTNLNLHNHHIFPGNGYRKNSDKEGLTVYLCQYHHEYVHHDFNAMLELQKIAQREFEKNKTREEFIRLFTKSVLDD